MGIGVTRYLDGEERKGCLSDDQGSFLHKRGKGTNLTLATLRPSPSK